MSTAPVVVADDSVVEKRLDDSRPAGWWHLPATTTVLGLIALVFFGPRGLPGAESVYALARETDLNPLGLVPERVTLPSQGGAIVLSVLALAASAGLWVLQARQARPSRGVRIALIAVFAVAWVLAFMTWVISQRSLDVTTLLQGTIVLAVPLAFGALSGVLSERAGVINIAIEGQSLFGAFGATLVGSLTGNVWLGLLAAPLVALIMGAAAGALRGRLPGPADHRRRRPERPRHRRDLVLLRHRDAGQPRAVQRAAARLPTLRVPVLADLPVIGRVLFEQNILVYLMWIIVAGLTVALFRTRWGLRVRAVGEHPKAADTVGIAVNLTRWKNVLLGAAVAGLGGATLTIGTGVAFGEEMSAGKGYIALAAMILGRYHPVGAPLAALTFAFADSLQRAWAPCPPPRAGSPSPATSCSCSRTWSRCSRSRAWWAGCGSPPRTGDPTSSSELPPPRRAAQRRRVPSSPGRGVPHRVPSPRGAAPHVALRPPGAARSSPPEPPQ
ncbi:ABC transporter permease [Brachybacterium sp. GPGPB12]|uniref:ABC transporter permease n=1 Tax=Brachybacterium sp. GPGPB12 TaxID=3023517 RepID=UPI00313433A9